MEPRPVSAPVHHVLRQLLAPLLWEAAGIIRNPSEITLWVMCLQLLASLGLVWQGWGRSGRSKRSVTAVDERKIPEQSSARLVAAGQTAAPSICKQ